MSGVVVFSPSRFSLYTICVSELLIRNDVDIKAIVVRRLFNPRRFVFEFGRDGTRLLKKMWKKLVLRDKAYKDKGSDTIMGLMKSEGISFRSVDEFNAAYGVPIVYCNDLNDPVVVDTLAETSPEMVVFTGGGLIRKAVLDHSGAGILNCHMGILPPNRGMDVVEWPILEDELDQIGMTAHFMDPGVDTGDILRTKYVEVGATTTIKGLRDRFEPIMCRHIAQTCVDFLNGRIERQPQKQEDGKQYFIMHPRMMELAKTKLNRRAAQTDGEPDRGL